MNVNENNCQFEIKKFNSKAAVITPVLNPVRTSASAYILK